LLEVSGLPGSSHEPINPSRWARGPPHHSGKDRPVDYQLSTAPDAAYHDRADGWCVIRRKPAQSPPRSMTARMGGRSSCGH
jgi:hypothetical protein